MRSFASVLIAAALATLTSAAPVQVQPAGSTVSVSVPLQSSLPSVPLSTGATNSLGESQGKSVKEAVGASDVSSNPPSVAIIFSSISDETQPYTEQLTYLAPSNCTITEITSAVSSVNTSITAALPKLQALVGAEPSVILAPAHQVIGDAKLSVSQIASIVGGDVVSILAAAGNVLDATKTQGGEIVGDAKDVLTGLGCAVASLVSAANSLVDGLSTSLTPMMAPVRSVVSELDSSSLSIALGLTA